MNNEMYNLALSYLARGWSVLPCNKAKIPLLPWKQWQNVYPTKSEIFSWFENFPDAQIGIITGKLSNLTVVDVELHGDPSELPQETMIVQSGNHGYHYYYLFDESAKTGARVKHLTDLRSEGGYVVAGGSRSEKGPYTILQDVPLLPFPKELFPEKKIDIFQSPETASYKTYEKKPLVEYAGYGKGQRNDMMAKFIGYILTQVHPADWDSVGWELILRANERNTPPLPQNELLRTFNSIKGIERQNNPLGRVARRQGLSGGILESDAPLILDDGEDEVKHIAEVADSQKLNQSDIYPLEMKCFDDSILGGVSPGDLIVVAGKTGNGKTSLVQDWTFSLIRGSKKPKALWFSYEVLVSHLWNKFKEMGATREDCIFIPAKHATGNVAWIEKKIKEGKEKYGIKLVMIDHLGFLLPKTEGVMGKNISANYSTFLTQIVRDLKTIAIREEVIIFLPVHMRKTEKSSGKWADVDDIKDSGGIANESDLVFLIERERNKDKDAKSYFTDVTKITLAKNRKTGVTVIANFTMINNRFAYDDSQDKADEAFKSFEEVKKVETISELYNGVDEKTGIIPADPKTF